MSKAELQFNLGANNTQAKQKIAEVKKDGIDASAEIQQKNKEGLKQVIGMIAPMAIAVKGLMMLFQGIGESIKKFFAQGEAFTKWAEKANVSAHSVAYLKAQADSAGVSAKEFEQAMADLSSGNATLAQLEAQWGKVGDKIKSAQLAQENFEKLARSKNFELFGKGSENFFGGMANGALEMLGFGGSELSAIERSAYEGKSFEEALAEGQKARKGYSAPVSEARKRDAYYSALAKKQEDEIATKKRTMETTAKKLAEADISADDRVRIFKERTGQTLSNDAILALAESIKTNEEKLTDTIKKATEEEKKRADDAKKEDDKQKKFQAEFKKAQNAVKDTFTAGGGLIGGANYAIRNADAMRDVAEVSKKQLHIQRKQEKTLEDVRAILKGE